MAFELLNEIVDPGVALKWNALAKRAMETIRKYSKDAYILVGGINYNSVLSVPQLDPPMDDKIVYNFHCYDPQLFTHQSAYWQDFMPKGFHNAIKRSFSLSLSKKPSLPSISSNT